MPETEPGAVGQRAEDPGEDRKLMAAACGWSVVLESGGPGQQAVPWGEGGLRPWGHCPPPGVAPGRRVPMESDQGWGGTGRGA